MANPAKLQQAYVLHTRSYRDSSLLVDFLTEADGKLTAVARGVRRPKSRLRGLLQPFVPLWVAVSGRHDLQNLRSAEPNGPAHRLTRYGLVSAIYLNELLVRLLQRHDPHPRIFQAYDQVLPRLVMADNPELGLRRFELTLLSELGFGLVLNHVAHSHEAVDAEAYYHFQPEVGVIRVTRDEFGVHDHHDDLFLGRHLLAIQALTDGDNVQVTEDLEVILRSAKRIMRLALSPLLGNRPIISRQLFVRR